MAAIKGFEVSGTIYDNEDETARNGVQAVETSVNDLVSQKIYSTSDVDTGKKWVDGKPIYRKVVTATNQGQNATITFSPAIENLDLVISIEGFMKATTGGGAGYQLGIPKADEYYYVNTDTGVVQLMSRSTSYNAQYVHAIVEYTKTTD